MPGGDDYYDEIDAGILETLTILALAGALAFLVYYRQLRQQNHRRTVEEQQRREGHDNQAAEAHAAPAGMVLPDQQANGGLFPPPDDPNFDAWRAGGIGH